MKQLLRVLTLAAVLGGALALTGSALAAFTSPRLTVNRPSAGSVVIGFTQQRTDDALFRLQIYVPLGYTPALTAAPGSTIGAVAATVQANAISADAIVPLTGSIRVDSPTAPTHNEPADLACRGSAAPINAVWVLVLQSPTGPLEVPVYVTAPTAAPESTFAAAKLVLCLPSPYIPQSAGGAALGAKVIQAVLTVPGQLTAPTAAGVYAWHAIATPWTVGGGTPNVPGTVELQAIERQPAVLTATRAIGGGSAAERGRIVTIAGRLRVGGVGVNGGRVQLIRGTRVVATARTNASGAYAFRLRLPKGRYTYRARSTAAATDLGAPGCVQTVSPAPCLGATTNGYSAASPFLRFRIIR
jgi:hypothetical protein